MNKRLVLFVFILSSLAVKALILPTSSFESSWSLISQVERVHNLDTSLNYTTIQEAINANETLNGHTICVEEGTYYEHVVVKKSLSLIGENRSTTIIDGNNTGAVMKITANNVNITGFTMQRSGYLDSGVFVSSSGNSISYNIVINNNNGITLYKSSNNTVSGNNVIDNIIGIYLTGSSENVLRNNSMAGNRFNFLVDFADKPSDFVNDVDASNTVDGKPIYYWIDKHDVTVPSNAGYVILVNCTFITVQNLNLTGNEQGVLLAYTTNSTITRNNITNNVFGVQLLGSSSNNILENTITSNDGNGISLLSSSNYNKMSGNNITNNSYGIWCDKSSSDNSVSGNNITNNYVAGISLGSSNTISGNNITNNKKGVSIILSSNTTLSGNVMKNNRYNLEVSGNKLSHYMHSIDVSNFVDGKPIYYIINQTNLVINHETQSQVGFLAFINCENVTAEGLTLTNNWAGLLLVYTNNSKIISNNITGNACAINVEKSFGNDIFGNNITNNGYAISIMDAFDTTIFGNAVSENGNGVTVVDSFGNNISKNSITNNNGFGIWLQKSSNNKISENNVTACGTSGIELASSSNNTISRNRIINGELGIRLGNSYSNILSGNIIKNNYFVGISFGGSYNIVRGNTIASSYYGLWLSSSNNSIYHNNIIDNTQQVIVETSTNFWDNGIEGNYWSNYGGIDSNCDGIGNYHHFINVNNTDNHPLMGMFSSFNTTSEHNVQTVCNSTISDFQFYHDSENQTNVIKFKVSGTEGTGFCRICIPHAILNGTYVVLVDGHKPDYVKYNLRDNGTHRWIYFTYQHSIHEITIIPEFPSLTVLPLFMIATLLIVIVYRRKHST